MGDQCTVTAFDSSTINSSIRVLAGSVPVVTRLGFTSHSHPWATGRIATESDVLLLYVHKGSGRFTIHGHCAGELRPGYFFLAPSSSSFEYTLADTQPTEAYVVSLRGPVPKPAALPTQLTADSPCARCSNQHAVAALLTLMVGIARSVPAADACVALSRSMTMLWALALPARSVAASGGDPALFAAPIALMSSRIAAGVSVPELADCADLSTSHFAAAFRRQTGYSPANYFCRMKMAKAAELLEMGDATVQSVARALGFSDHRYFGRQFQRIMGESPLQYRQRTRGAGAPRGREEQNR